MSDEILSDLLVRTSRTFALAIPCLPMPVRREIMVAYLLFRLADTIEDGSQLNRAEKLSALDNLANLLRGETPVTPRSLDLPRSPSQNADYLALIDELPLVFQSVGRLRPAVRSVIIDSALTSLAGMKRFIAAGTTSGQVQIRSVAELRDYCFLVAGVVGEMLTEIFLADAPRLQDVRDQLDANAGSFGEGLQLVNILKDSDKDRRDGRIFIPAVATRGELFRLAREDLLNAEAYVPRIEAGRSPRGLRGFHGIALVIGLANVGVCRTVWPRQQGTAKRGPAYFRANARGRRGKHARGARHEGTAKMISANRHKGHPEPLL